MKKIIFVFLTFILLTGCVKEVDENKIIMKCNKKEESFVIKKGSTMKCELLNTEYTFKITDIDEDKVYFEIDKYGLTTSSSLITKQNSFTISKNEEIKLRTQSTDYQEYVYFNWMIK